MAGVDHLRVDVELERSAGGPNPEGSHEDNDVVVGQRLSERGEG